MAATDGPPVIKLGLDDAMAGLVLSTEAHWNQTEEDWRVFLREGVVFGIRTGVLLVATAALLPYSGNNAWISMVLVTSSHRRRGLATRLVDACLETARKNGLTSWLDATPEGVAVYGPLGFTPTLQLRRMKLVRPTRVEAPPSSSASIDALRARDRRATGLDRTALLSDFARRSGSRIVSSNGSHCAGSRRPDRPPHRPVVRRQCRGSAGPGSNDRALRDRPSPARRSRPAGCLPRRIDRLRLDHRAAVPAHALRPRHRHG